jgi:Ca2+-transporting ATPase
MEKTQPKEWYTLTAEGVVQEFDTHPTEGLTETEAVQRLEQYGTNELVERGKKNPWRILLDQFKEIMVIILIVAAIVSLLLGEYLDVIVIMAIVILNALLGYTQEHRAEQAMAALKKMAVPTVRVRRQGKVKEISSTALVPGDILLLEAGNLVPADSRVLESVNLKAQEAALTGESDPVAKKVAIPTGQNLVLGDRTNMLFMGTVITYGRGTAVVTETGMNTELGKIAELIQEVEPDKTPLQRRMAQLGKTLAWVALGIIVVVVLIGLLRDQDWELLFLTGVSLAVAAIPESLPAVVTITLALGSQRLLKRNALIRKLPAVEALGSITYICSDKTGTLTENRMTVTILDIAGHTEDIKAFLERRGTLLRARLDASDPQPMLDSLSVLVRAGALCNDAVLEKESDGVYHAIGDPTEAALVLAAQELGYDKSALEETCPRVAEVPFTSERKRMTTVHKLTEDSPKGDIPWCETPYVLFSKGAVDSLLSITSQVLVNNEIVPIDEPLRQRILEANDGFAKQGQRVLGVSFRTWESPELPDEDLLEVDEVFVGLVAMMDPPRPEVKDAVATARKAGIQPVMITGDTIGREYFRLRPCRPRTETQYRRSTPKPG